MWGSLSLPWQVCLEEAWEAYCAGSVPIGAVVTDAAGHILARARNRIADSEGEAGTLYGQTLAHAEVNVLTGLPPQGKVDRHTCALYTTVEPCPLCLGAIYMSGVRQLHYAARDPFAGSTNLLGATPYLSRKPIEVFGPQRADLEIISLALGVEFELSHDRGESTRQLLEVWRAVVPQGVSLGEALFQMGELNQMREKREKAPEVVNQLKFHLMTGE